MNTINKVGNELLPLDVVRDPKGPSGSFAAALGEALNAVDAAQVGADQEAARLATGAGNLHETALALEQADISMRVATKVRNRLVDAYQEIMRMGI